jgi:hypothetical protein
LRGKQVGEEVDPVAQLLERDPHLVALVRAQAPEAPA